MINTPRQFVQAYELHGSIRAVAREHNMSRRQVTKLYEEALKMELIEKLPVGSKSRDDHKNPSPVMSGKLHAMQTPAFALPKKGAVARYLLTYAQNNTELHEGLWKNLLALTEHPKTKCKLMVARGTYVKTGMSGNEDKDVATGKTIKKQTESFHWDDRLDGFLYDERAEIAPGLVWCGEMNIIPTAVRPLSAMESYTGRKSTILPHPRVAMDSVASGKFENTKFMYTTGAVTMRNYIKRKTGLKAEFHHVYGALMVEVDSDGNWWCRQLNADSEGTLYDLDMKVENGKVTFNNRVEGINWGDIHHIRLDPMVKEVCWGKDGVMDQLKPKFQFLNDVLDFRSRNHHERGLAYKLLERWVDQEEDVETEVARCMEFIREITPVKSGGCHTVVVDSNHDQALMQWLERIDGHTDPVNMEFWHKANYFVIRAIKYDRKNFNILKWCYKTGARIRKSSIVMRDLKNITFLAEDESFILCQDAHGGIECGMHGHRGPNGSYGGPIAYAKMGRKCNIGHSHTARIFDGVYYAGVMAYLDLDYNKGPSSWSQSLVITYPNGKRAVVTIWNGKFRA